MASLASCIKKAGKALSQDDAAQIREIHDDYVADGMKSSEAAQRAIDDYLGMMDEELSGLIQQAEQQGADTRALTDSLSYFKDRSEPAVREIDPGPLRYRMDDEVVEEIDNDPTSPFAMYTKDKVTVEDQMNYNPGSVEQVKNFAETAKEGSYSTFLKFIPRRYLQDFLRNKVPSIKKYLRIANEMAGRANELLAKYEATGKTLNKYLSNRKTRKNGKVLGELMLSSTLAGVDPSKEYTSLKARANMSEADKALDAKRRGDHTLLKGFYDNLDPEGQRLFNEVRDQYSDLNNGMREALEERIEASDADPNAKAALLDKLRAQFETGRVNGPYFPLARFGEYWSAAQDADTGDTISYARFETVGEQRAWIKEMRDSGFKILKGRKGDNHARVVKDIDPKFLADVTNLVGKENTQMADEIWQMYLSALPEMSARKAFMHRKGRMGFSGNITRAYGFRMFHGSNQLARLEHMHQLEDQMTNIEQEARVLENSEDPDANWATPIFDEMQLRHDWAKNPTNAAWASKLTSLGFVAFLGLTPAAALVNLSQTAIVAFPVLAARFNTIGAFGALSKASLQWAAGRGSLKDKLRGDERKAFEEFERNGLLSKTQAHDLAQISEGMDPSGIQQRAMEIVSWLFHRAEMANREVTSIAGYRLARKKGLAHEDAIIEAEDLTWDSHFDYCVPLDTECLTTEGWKRHDDLLPGDVAIAIDEQGNAVDSVVKDVNVFPGKKHVTEFSGQNKSARFSMAATDGHKHVVQNYNSRDKKWQDIRLVETEDLKNSHHLLRAPLGEIDRPNSIGVDMASLLGWILAEGYFGKFRGCKHRSDVRLYQSSSHNTEYCLEIQALLDRLDPNTKHYAPYDGSASVITWVLSGDLRKQVVELIPDKKLPVDLVGRMSAKELRAMLSAFLKGDGSRNESGGWVVEQADYNASILGGMQAAATMLGKTSTLRDNTLIIHATTKRSHVRPLVKTVKTVDSVWCPTTEHGTWIARRNGCVFVTGNSNENRPALMHNNIMKVALLFRNYSLNMTYRLGRDFRDGVLRNQQVPVEVRNEAAQRLGGIMGMTGIMAGVTGMPMFWLVEGVLNAIFGDEEEPYDTRAAMRVYFEERYGDEVAHAIMKGPVDELTGATVSSRVSLNNLWWREAPSHLEGAELGMHYMSEVIGPIPRMVTEVFTYAELADQGYGDRAEEKIPVKAVKDVLKAMRYAGLRDDPAGGVQTKQGSIVIPREEMNGWDIFWQSIGFQPSVISWQYEKNREVYEAAGNIERNRERVKGRLALAIRHADQKEFEEAWKGMMDYNAANPEFALRPGDVISSIKSRQRHINDSIRGVNLPKKLRYLHFEMRQNATEDESNDQ